VAFAFLVAGLKRAFGHPSQYRGKIAGPILSGVSILVLLAFCALILLSRRLPQSLAAPHVADKAPPFVLPDTDNHPVSLSDLLSQPMENSAAPPKGVLLVFYRGYW
jgi:hypothetical protein